VLKKIHGHIKYLETEIEEIDGQLLSVMQTSYKEYWEILQTIPGMSEISSAMMIIETGEDMSRFGSMKQFCSWAGMCPGNNESAGKRYSGRTRKGNRQIRQLLCEIANGASRTDSQFKSKHKSLVIRRGYKRAIFATGHKIARIIYVLLRYKKPYQDPGIDYEELVVKKNAPRWISALQKYGYVEGKAEVQ